MKKQPFCVTVIVLLFGLIGSLSYSQKAGQPTITLKDGMARIIYTRHGNMMGAAVVHVVVDKADSLNFNAFILQKKSFPAEKFNFDKAGNIKLMYVKISPTEAKLVMGKPQEGDKKINHPFDLKAFPELAAIPGPFKSYIGLDPVYFVNSAGLKLNARITCAVGSGDTFSWDRPAGIMQLEDITSGGDQAFAATFKVEPGKTYTVDYYYMKAKFEIKEK